MDISQLTVDNIEDLLGSACHSGRVAKITDAKVGPRQYDGKRIDLVGGGYLLLANVGIRDRYAFGFSGSDTVYDPVDLPTLRGGVRWVFEEVKLPAAPISGRELFAGGALLAVLGGVGAYVNSMTGWLSVSAAALVSAVAYGVYRKKSGSARIQGLIGSVSQAWLLNNIAAEASETGKKALGQRIVRKALLGQDYQADYYQLIEA